MKKKKQNLSLRRGNNEGSVIRLHANGKYYTNVSLGLKKDGSRDRRSIYGITKDEVREKADAMRVAHRQNQLRPNSETTLGEWIDYWLQLKRPQIAANTYSAYVSELKMIPNELRDRRIQQIKRTDLRAMEADLNLLGASVRRRGKLLQHLRNAFEEAIEAEIVTVNAARNIRVRATAAEQQARLTASEKALTDDELALFLEAAQEDALYPLFYLMFSLGLRVGEALGLRWSDIDVKDNSIKIIQQIKLEVVDQKVTRVAGALKTVQSRRTLYASDDLCEVLERHRLEQNRERNELEGAWPQSNLVFTTNIGTPINRNNVNRSIRRICDSVTARATGLMIDGQPMPVKLDQTHGFVMTTPEAASVIGVTSTTIRKFRLANGGRNVTEGIHWLGGTKRNSGHPAILWTHNGMCALTNRFQTPRAKALAKILKQVDFAKLTAPVLRRFSSHAARHTMISGLLRDGEKLEVVSAIAGHARPSITADFYRRVFDEEKRAVRYSIASRLKRVKRPGK